MTKSARQPVAAKDTFMITELVIWELKVQLSISLGDS